MIAPFDENIARRPGALAGELANDGRPVSDGDVIIGATAMVVDELVLTRNVGKFERLGVEVETY